MDRLNQIYKELFNKYKIFYTKKEMEIAIAIMVFIYYILDNAEEYKIELNSMLAKEVIPVFIQIGKNDIIKNEILVRVEKELNMNNYISNAYERLCNRKEIQFMQVIAEDILVLYQAKKIEAEELIEFFNIQEEKGKNYINEFVSKIASKRIQKIKQNILDNFAGIGERLLEINEDRQSYMQLQDIDENKCVVATILCIMKKHVRFRVINENTLNYDDKSKYDLIISIPPLVMDTTIANTSEAEIPDAINKRDYWAGIQVSLKKLNNYGMFITMVYTGALTSRRRQDIAIREYICKQEYKKTIIELPEKMLNGTGAKVALVILIKGANNDITLINLDDEECKDYLINSSELTKEGIDEICEIMYNNQKSDIAMKIDKDSILEDSILLPSLYKTSNEKYQHKDIMQLKNLQKRYQIELNKMDEEYENILEKLMQENIDNTENIYLITETSEFINKKPMKIKMHNEYTSIFSWRDAFRIILTDVMKNSRMKDRIMDLRYDTQFKRIAYSDKGMKSPLRLAENLYIEMHSGTEQLMSFLIRILNTIHYDYRDICIIIEK